MLRTVSLLLVAAACVAGNGMEGMEGLEGLAGLFGGGGGGDGGGDGEMDLEAMLGGLFGGGGKAKPGGVCGVGRFEAPKLLGDLRPGYVSANGCGPEGMAIAEDFGLWRCCHSHDVCFTACGTTFKFCESKFSKCMKKVCKMPHNAGVEAKCTEQAQSFSGMTGMMASGIHASGMKEVCLCFDTKEEATAQHRAFVRDVLEQHGPEGTEVDDAFVDKKMSKFKKKPAMGRVNFDLFQKYGEKFVRQSGNLPIVFSLDFNDKHGIQVRKKGHEEERGAWDRGRVGVCVCVCVWR